jgi:hypothetical protein
MKRVLGRAMAARGEATHGHPPSYVAAIDPGSTNHSSRQSVTVTFGIAIDDACDAMTRTGHITPQCRGDVPAYALVRRSTAKFDTRRSPRSKRFSRADEDYRLAKRYDFAQFAQSRTEPS